MDGPYQSARAESTAPVAPHAELVLPNGLRRPLTASFSVLGRAPGCDVRVNASAVNPLHCALVCIPGGLVLRDLYSEVGTLVNGERVTLCMLREGDNVTVGPFQFRVHIPATEASAADLPRGAGAVDGMDALQREKDALRIQAAAVAAQQAALTEEEIRLKQRDTSLQRQEEQLAAHLEAKRRQLAGLQEQLGTARAVLRRERADFEQKSQVLLAGVEAERKEATEAHQRAARDRTRFVELRRRLKRRWRKHWSVHETVLHRREKDLEGEWQRLAAEADRVQKEREALIESRLCFNAEMELGRRQLHDDRAALARAQRSWADRRMTEKAEVRGQSQVLRERETLLAEVERELLDEKQHWEGSRQHLEKEIEGLESRARNLRQKLLEQQQDATRLGVQVLQNVPSLPSPAAVQKEAARSEDVDQVRLELFEGLVGDMADQRVQLAEQFSRLVQAVDSWRQAHVETIAELESVALYLEEREHRVLARERGLDVAEADICQRGEDMAAGRCQLDAWRARLIVRESAWETDRATLLSHVQASEELTKRQLAVLDDLRRNWKQRRRQETGEFQKTHAQFVEARRLYATLWEECLRRSAAMDQEKRTLAEKTLALETYRLEIIGQAEDAATAERQIERLRRRWASLFTEAERNLTRERQALEVEIGRIETRSRQIEQDAAELACREAEQATRVTEWEDHQSHVDEANVRLRKELDRLRFERAQHDQQLTALRDEVERIAHTLLEQAEPLLLPTSQAA